ncbi:MAG TPA: biotin/lipoyl-binding protein, partial [Candidatus Cloacimonadota bacterium]|nr:biotin/lipoyl-binding protein [Candidatus Cloacimonadota bacterium]
MKEKKIRLILIASLIIILITIIFSYALAAHSQKYPAVVRSDKVFVSAQVDGIVKEFYVTSMQMVQKNDPLAEIENPKLPLQLQNMREEVSKYEEMVASAQSGDYLHNELLKLEEDIHNAEIDLNKAEVEVQNVSEKLDFMEQRFQAARKQYEANKKLYTAGMLNNSDFEKFSGDYWKVHETYYDLKGDSLIAWQNVKNNQSIIKALKDRKVIMAQSSNSTASEYFLDMKDVLIDIDELEEQIKSLHIVSPIAG